MELRPGYKQTEAGVIPDDWNVVPMGQVGECLIGLTYSPLDVRDYGTLVLRSSNVQGGRLAFDDNVFVDMEIPARAITRTDDILICVRNGSRQLIGKCALIDKKTAGSAFGAFMSVLRSESARFLFYQFQSSLQKRQIDEVMGATINQITNRDMASFKVIWPPTNAEQEAIAEALSDADALIESLEHLLTKKRHLKQAAMQELLTGKKRLPGVSGEWEVKRLGEVLARLANGALYQPSNSSGLPVTRIETIADGTIDMSRVGYGAQTPELEEYRMQADDILFSHINSIDHIGKVAMYNGELPLYHGMNLLLLRAGRSLDSRFLFNWLGSHAGRSKAVTRARQAVSQASINTSDLRQVEIPFPLLSEQTAIATVLSDMDAELADLEGQLAKIRALKQGMMQKLLTGEIRLI